MPSFLTHFAFSEECRPFLPPCELSDAVRAHPQAYYTGMQGPDMFLYYLPAVLRKKRISTELHTRAPERLLTCLWRQAAKSKGKCRPIALAYAVGFLGHYCLDSETHPFVYAHSGIKRSAKSFCVHNALESDLNGIAIERTFGRPFGKAPHGLPLPDVYTLSKDERAVIGAMLSRAIKCVYKLTCSSEAVIRAIDTVHLACRLLNDPSGRKAKLVQIPEALLHLPYLSPLFLGNSHFYPDAANFEHRQWEDPYTGRVSDTDFFMLYDTAKEKYTCAIASLQTLAPSEYPSFFRALCKRDFHGEPC